jgi:hypothetical protein
LIDLNKYKDLVQAVTSAESNDTEMMILLIRELESKVNVSLLLTGAVGLSAEAGEIMEIVKTYNRRFRAHLVWKFWNSSF